MSAFWCMFLLVFLAGLFFGLCSCFWMIYACWREGNMELFSRKHLWRNLGIVSLFLLLIALFAFATVCMGPDMG